jgi:phage shock protein A
LVLYDHAGQPRTVRYEAVNAMLLNEFQKQQRKVKEQDQTIRDLKDQLHQLSAQMAALGAELHQIAGRSEVPKATPADATSQPAATLR